MKKIIIYCCIILGFFLSSCSQKEVKVLSLKIQGDLKGCYTLVDSVCVANKNSDGKYEIQVNIKRTEESVPFTTSTVETFGNNTDQSLVLGGIGYEIYDENKNLLLSIDGSENEQDKEGQLNILKLEPGKSAPMKIVFKNEVPDGIVLTSELKFLSTGEVPFEGSIGKYGIKNCTLDFNFANKKIIGQYQYLSSPAGAFLYLMGNVVTEENKPGNFTSNILIAEDNGRGELTGKFKGQLKLVRDSKTSPYYYVLVGTFRNFNFRDFRYELKSSPITEIKSEDVLKNSYASTMNPSFVKEDFSQFGFKSFNEEAAYNSHETEDISIDDFLRQYRHFIKKYASVIKKYKAGDTAVSLEYLELCEQATELSKKAESIKGEMSAAQVNELNNIMQEFAKLAAL